MTTLRDYDSTSFGPLFAVSDEGSSARVVREAAYASAKARALSSVDPVTLGVILDGERMTSAGEVPIGPDEYEVLNAVTAGRIPCTTNVGVRVNARLLQPLPEVSLTPGAEADAAWIDGVCAAFSPFLHTPDGQPRPLTVRILVDGAGKLPALDRVSDSVAASRDAKKIGPRALHRLAVIVKFDKRIGTVEVDRIKQVIDAASAAGIDEVTVDGELREAARLRLSVQGLLNVLDVESLRTLLAHATSRGVRLTHRHRLDVPSAARTVWTGLHAARTMGFAAGKYGLVPMTLEEQRQAVTLVQGWTRGWTAIPAFYVDTPLVTDTDVFDPSRAVDGALTWLRMVHGVGVDLVLFDCPDRIGKARKLLRSDASAASGDPGVLTLEQVETILAEARDLGVSILWSGGITDRQAFELAKRRVHGLFSTSSTAQKTSVTPPFADDPSLPAENEPTAVGVRRVHALVQGGFLSVALRTSDHALAAKVESLSEQLLQAKGDDTATALRLLDAELLTGWRLWQDRPAAGEEVAVSPDAVRVFRGRRRTSVSDEVFLKALGGMFMPVTVQMQRLYGLTAYLPAVLPIGHAPSLPDEIALVFYRTQAAYHLAKQCVGGRAYSEMHELVFDMKASKSDFPRPFTGTLDLDQPYHLFSAAVDWQCGSVALYVGSRLPTLAVEGFRRGVAERMLALQQSPGDADAAIFCGAEDWVILWVHTPGEAPPRIAAFDSLATPVLALSPQRVAIPGDLTTPYAGFQISEAGGSFLTQFPRFDEQVEKRGRT